MPKKATSEKKEKKQKTNKTKEEVKTTKLEIKNYDDKKVFEKEKAEFLNKKKRRGKSKKENTSLPASMKNLISEYDDVMANLGASDVAKYDTFKKYNKNKKAKK